MKTINASAFKAKCLAILDEVAETGQGLTILKHGKPVAQLVPPAPQFEGLQQERLRGTVEFLGHVVQPVVESAAWEAEAGPWPEP